MKIETLEKFLDNGFTHDEIMRMVDGETQGETTPENNNDDTPSDGENSDKTIAPSNGDNNAELLNAIKDLNKSIQAINRAQGATGDDKAKLPETASAVITNFIKGAK